MKAKIGISILKFGIIAALALSAGYIAFVVPETAAAVPAVETVEARYTSYSPAVAAKGTLTKQGEQWLAIVAVGEGDISEIEIGQNARLSGAAFPSGAYGGRVSAIADTAYTMQTAGISEIVVDVTVTVEEGDVSVLRSGYSVTAELEAGESREIIMLPYSAIRQDDEGEYVYVLQNGAAVRKNIVTGIELSDRTEIVSGISGRDTVISEPEEVREGERVRGRSKN